MRPDLPLSQQEPATYWLGLPGDWVEEPNQRRSGMSGVQRVEGHDGRHYYRKQQVGHLYRSLRHPFGRPTILREYDALQACQRLQVPVPRIAWVHGERRNGQWHAWLVTEALDGFVSLEQCYAEGLEQRWGLQRHAERVRAVGVAIGRLNADRRQHGCLYPKHVFFGTGERVEVMLIDFEKSRRRLSAGQAARHDLAQLWRRCGWRGELWQAFMQGYREGFGGLPRLPAFLRGDGRHGDA